VIVADFVTMTVVLDLAVIAGGSGTMTADLGPVANAADFVATIADLDQVATAADSKEVTGHRRATTSAKAFEAMTVEAFVNLDVPTVPPTPPRPASAMAKKIETKSNPRSQSRSGKKVLACLRSFARPGLERGKSGFLRLVCWSQPRAGLHQPDAHSHLLDRPLPDHVSGRLLR
jgi:hypothetical protein